MTDDRRTAQTPLYDWHVAHGGRMVDFAGWSMPVQYSSIIDEHKATRTAVGLFDISHMGRLRFERPRRGRFLDAVVTRRVADMRPGQIRYALVCNDGGGILDDVLVYRLAADEPGATTTRRRFKSSSTPATARRSSTGSAPARPTTPARLRRRARRSTAMIAVQGPRRRASSCEPLVGVRSGSTMRYYTGADSHVRRQRRASSAAPATPARTAARSSAPRMRR